VKSLRAGQTGCFKRSQVHLRELNLGQISAARKLGELEMVLDLRLPGGLVIATVKASTKSI